MVFVVRRDLGWHKQKLAVMTAHAALALFKKVYKSRNPALMQWVRGHEDVCDSAPQQLPKRQELLSFRQCQAEVSTVACIERGTSGIALYKRRQRSNVGSSVSISTTIPCIRRQQQQHHASCGTMLDSS
jgi:hypothetical protein